MYRDLYISYISFIQGISCIVDLYDRGYNINGSVNTIKC